MREFLSELAKSVNPYTAGEQPQDREYIKLNTNENAYPPAPEVDAVLKTIDYRRLTRYSDPDNKVLKQALSKRYGVPEENLFVGNGSDEVLAFCFPAFFNRQGTGVVFADITYSFYPVYCGLFGIPYRTVPLKCDFSQDLPAYDEKSAEGFIIANPNAPTGIALSIQQIEDFVRSHPSQIVIVDEAYAAFAGCSAVSLTAVYENLLVVNTFSKEYSLAGIRAGWAAGNAALIDGLNRIKNCFNSYTMNTLTEYTAAAAVGARAYYQEITQKIIDTREWFSKALRGAGFEVLPSSANFVFVRKEGWNAAKTAQSLREQGILVRHFDRERIADFLRISIGTDVQMQKVFDCMTTDA